MDKHLIILYYGTIFWLSYWITYLHCICFTSLVFLWSLKLSTQLDAYSSVPSLLTMNPSLYVSCNKQAYIQFWIFLIFPSKFRTFHPADEIPDPESKCKSGLGFATLMESKSLVWAHCFLFVIPSVVRPFSNTLLNPIKPIFFWVFRHRWTDIYQNSC